MRLPENRTLIALSKFLTSPAAVTAMFRSKPHSVCPAVFLAVFVIVPLLGACGSSSSSSSDYVSSGITNHREFDEDEARERAEDDLSDETYTSSGATYGCTDDCEGHEAGFRWARENGITDGSCNGNSDSFNEGCQAYADAIEEKVNEYRDDDEEETEE